MTTHAYNRRISHLFFQTLWNTSGLFCILPSANLFKEVPLPRFKVKSLWRENCFSIFVGFSLICRLGMPQLPAVRKVTGNTKFRSNRATSFEGNENPLRLTLLFICFYYRFLVFLWLLLFCDYSLYTKPAKLKRNGRTGLVLLVSGYMLVRHAGVHK